MGEKIEKDWEKVRESAEGSEDEVEMSEAHSEDADIKSQDSLDNPSYEELEEKLTNVEQEAFANREKSIRALAELENVRRRSERDVTNAHRYAMEKFIDALLPVVDSLEQAIDLATKEEDKNMLEGLELTMKLFVDILDRNNVKQLHPLGEVFDPNMHEAMSIQPAGDAVPNTVVAVFQKGYVLHDRVIRPARVVVAKK